MKQRITKQAYLAALADERRAFKAMFDNWTPENKAAYRAACSKAEAAYWAAYPKTPPATGQKVKA
jgi:hypothetical protein